MQDYHDLPFDVVDLPSAEKSIIAAFINDEKSRRHIIELSPNDFTGDRRYVFQAVLKLYSQRQTIDLVTVCDIMSANNDPVHIGAAVVEISKTVCTWSTIQPYIDIVKRETMRRNINQILTESIYENQKCTSPAQVRASVLSKLQSLQEAARQSNDDMMSLAIDTYNYISDAVQGLLPQIATGIPELDEKILRFEGGEFIVIAARPGVGKSAFMLEIIANFAKHKKRVFVGSREMTRIQIGLRMFSQITGINTNRMRVGNGLTEQDMAKLADAMGIVSQYTMVVNDTIATIEELRERLSEMYSDGGLGLVVIDYLQLMETLQRTNNRQEAVSIISRQLKCMSIEFNVPIIGLSQLTRASLQHEDGEPQLSDLRESGSIEQDANMVIMLYEPLDKCLDENLLQIKENAKANYGNLITAKIAKNRQGELAKVNLLFFPAIMSWVGVKNNVY